MSEWKECILSDHIDLISGYAFKSKDFLENQEEDSLPIIKIKNVANGDVNLDKVVYHKYDASLSKFLLTKGDVLIAMTGNHPQAQTQVVGDVSKYKLGVNSLLNQRVGKIVPKGETDLDFVYYFFKDKDTHRYLANQSSGSANQANISKATIIGLKSELPEPTEQKQIAEVLTSLDDKIDLLHRQNKTLEAMAETLFREWFVEGAEEDWETTDISTIAIFKNGKSKPKTEGGIPIYGGNGILGYSDSSNASGESIIIGRVGAYCGSLYFENKEIWVSDNAILLKGKDEKYIYFLFYLLKNKNLNSMAEGSSHPLLTQTLLNKISILIPSDSILELFNTQIKTWMRKMEFNIRQVSKLEKLRDTLLPKLMNGEVKVVEND